VCQRLAAEGVSVAILDRNIDAAESVEQELRQSGGRRPTAWQVDISDRAQVDAAAAGIVADGPVQILINNAGWDEAKPFLETSPALWQQLIAINYVGPMNMMQALLPQMVDAGGGRVVNVASDAGRVGSSGEAVYAGCKAGVIAMGKSVARELARSGVSINAVCPGPTDTPLLADFAGEGEYGDRLRAGLTRAIPMRRLGEAADVAGVITFLASDDAKFITGQTISVSGGLTMHG
jgi:2-hydroxycyclohexanecarboxyl-CoA dehydrogenase